MPPGWRDLWDFTCNWLRPILGALAPTVTISGESLICLGIDGESLICLGIDGESLI